MQWLKILFLMVSGVVVDLKARAIKHILLGIIGISVSSDFRELLELSYWPFEAVLLVLF